MSLILSGTDGLSDVDGTAATPAIRGTDANTGIFFPAADTIAFADGGAEVMRLDSSGNLGLGVSAPQNKLQVVTTTRPQFSVSYNGTTGLYLEDSTASVGKSWKIATSTAVNSSLEFYQSTATSGVPVWAASPAMTLNTNGVLVLQGASTSANGVGIAFPATQSASSNANTLDDYEEGTWTPVMSGSTTAGTGTYGGQAGAYRKIGSVVYYSLDMSWTAHTGTGDMILSGLPFTSNSTYCAGALRASTGLALSASHYPQVFVNINATTFSWEQFPVGGGFQSNIAMDTSAAIMVTGFYFV